MTKPLPSLALDMSQDGIALHQLAFDGHWHELARVALDDPALRERLANMRGIAAKLEGRRFNARIWLPDEQIMRADISLIGKDASARQAKARAEIAAKFGGKPGDYAIKLGQRLEGGAYPVAAVRIRTMQEARSFAKSHGFKARSYGTQSMVEGFAQPPHFQVPADKVKLAGLGLVATTSAALVLGGGYAFFAFDPLNLWESPPRAADFAPFQQPNPGIERAGAPPLPTAGETPPAFPAFAGIANLSLPAALPYLPPRQLTADAQESIEAPAVPDEDMSPLALQPVTAVPVNWPASLAPLPGPESPDSQPSIGLFNLQDRISAPPRPEAGTSPPPPSGPMASYRPRPRPVTVANTAFYLEPLPAMASRLSPAALAEFISRSGLSLAQLSRMAPPLLIAGSKLVEVTPGLPPIMPLLRSGRAIPEQVAPPPEAAPTGPPPLFTLVSGRPDILPQRRPAEPALGPDGQPLPFQLVNGAPEIRPRTRPAEAPAADDIAPAEPRDSETANTGPDDNAALAAAVNAAVDSTQPAPPTDFALINGRPDLLPLLRSGAAIPPLTLASAASANLDPAVAEANALRPRRRPASIANIPPPIADPMISGAAPASATRPLHRAASFAANAARIVEQNSNRPRVSAPVVPADPGRVSLPTSASVARSATIENAINLRKTNLIGIYGTADNRTALIMISGGRMVRVKMGESFSGWTVVAISGDTVRIRKRRREEILRMPAE